jgi:hypothetical protein
MRPGIEERFWNKADWTRDEVACWSWGAYVDDHGYGRFKVATSWAYAHRVAYELERGEIPAGLSLDHLCRVRHCVNPWHLEPVTHHENVLRGANTKFRETCLRGHKVDEDNQVKRARPRTNRRDCKKCHASRELSRWYRAKEGLSNDDS